MPQIRGTFFPPRRQTPSPYGQTIHLPNRRADQEARPARSAQEHLAGLLSRAPRSACWDATARARARCCGSWPDRTAISTARPRSPTGFTAGYLSQEPQLNPDKDVLGQRRGSRRADPQDSRPLRRNQRPAGRGHQPRGDGKAARRAGPGAGPDRAAQRLGTRPAGRNRHGRDEPAAGRCRRRRNSPAASGAAWRSARFCSSAPTCCCSTNRPTTWTPKAWPGSNATWPNTPARSWPSRTIATFSTTSPAGFWSSTAARAFPGKATTPSWLEQKKSRLELEEKAASARQKTLDKELEWIRMAPAPAGQEQGPHQGLRRTVQPSNSKTATRSWRSRSRRASTWATW